MDFLTLALACCAYTALSNLAISWIVRPRSFRRGYELGRKRGFAEGYERGHVENSVWWVKQDAEVQREREKMWREKA